jgi:hypothetical protein
MNRFDLVGRIIPFVLVSVCHTGAPAMADVLSLSDVFTVSATAFGAQRYPDVTAVPDGFVVSWTGEVSTPPYQGKIILARHFDVSGVATGPEQIIGGASSNELLVRLAPLKNGRVFATWQDDSGLDGDWAGIFGAVMNADGLLTGDAFQINRAYTDGLQRSPEVAAAKNSVLTVWTDDAAPATTRLRVAGQRFDLDENFIFDEVTIARDPDEIAYWPVITAIPEDEEDEFVVAWESFTSASVHTGFDIAARIIGPGATLSSRIVLNEDKSEVDQGNPSIASTARGFIAAWTTFRFDDWDVYARRFDSLGNPTSAEFRVSSDHLYNQSAPSIATSANGDFVVLWATTTGGSTVYGRAFDADGTPLGEQFRVSTKRRGFQGDPFVRVGVSFVNNTDFVATWTETNGDTDPDVDARLFRVSHSERMCGDAVGDDLTIRSLDALFVLRAVVQSESCPLCICDTNGSGTLNVTDAAETLRIAVGLNVKNSCTHCSP